MAGEAQRFVVTSALLCAAQRTNPNSSGLHGHIGRLAMASSPKVNGGRYRSKNAPTANWHLNGYL
eukprot:1207237-Pleurochrysis_carterae.AAC.1